MKRHVSLRFKEGMDIDNIERTNRKKFIDDYIGFPIMCGRH